LFEENRPILESNKEIYNLCLQALREAMETYIYLVRMGLMYIPGSFENVHKT